MKVAVQCMWTGGIVKPCGACTLQHGVQYTSRYVVTKFCMEIMGSR